MYFDLLRRKKHRNHIIYGVFINITKISDPDRIQTCNPQSRNLMRYSVAPRGQNILIYKLRK